MPDPQCPSFSSQSALAVAQARQTFDNLYLEGVSICAAALGEALRVADNKLGSAVTIVADSREIPLSSKTLA